jgi:hypothetical protein
MSSGVVVVDVREPEGNVFAILAIARGLHRRLVAGGDELMSWEALECAATDTGSYDGVLDKLLEVLGDELVFIGRVTK